jgi:ABC-type transporter Mla subunit MlaD
MMHLMKDDGINLENFEAFVTWLEEPSGDPDHMNTTKRALTKLCQGDRDFIAYYAEFQRLISDLNSNATAKHEALHHGLSKELKDILSTQDHPKRVVQLRCTREKMPYAISHVQSRGPPLLGLKQIQSYAGPPPCIPGPCTTHSPPHQQYQLVFWSRTHGPFSCRTPLIAQGMPKKD